MKDFSGNSKWILAFMLASVSAAAQAGDSDNNIIQPNTRSIPLPAPLVGIQQPNTRSIPLPAPMGGKSPVSKYVYVTDEKLNVLSVYPKNVPNPSPLKIVPFDSYPQGVVVDQTGNVYVALPSAGQIQVFSPGAESLLYVINSAGNYLGLDTFQPYAMTFDSSGNLYVLNSGGMNVLIYPAGASTPSNGFVAFPATVGGIAVSSNGTVYVSSLLGGSFAMVQQCAPKSNKMFDCSIINQIILGIPTSTLVVLGNDLVAQTPNGVLTYFSINSWNVTNENNLGLTLSPLPYLKFSTSDSSGTLYLPVNYNGANGIQSSVIVTPADSSMPIITITQGIVSPAGAAASD